MATKKRSTAAYYAANPKAKAHKAAYDKKFNQKPEQRKKRVELVTYNRKKHDPVGNHTDARHKGSKIVGYVKQSVNRASKTDAPGDKRSRGSMIHRKKK